MKASLLALVLLVSALLAGGCARPNDNRSVLHRETEIAELEAQIAAMRDALALEQSRPAPQPEPQQSTLQDDLEGTGATASNRGREVVITVDNAILFASGSAKLTNDAKRSLAQIVRVINNRYPGKELRIAGHTDNQPIVRTRDKWSDNWELSAARSLSVLRELISAGIPEAQIHFAGYGEFAPVADNNNRSNRAKNRRVEIIVLDAAE